jgi:hypothetical protein
MEFIHGLYILLITMTLFNHNLINVEGRKHIHTKQKTISNPAPPESSPSVPSDPYPNDPRDSSSDCIFDVRSFGAIGDGSCDDTPAFKKAWKAACAVESGVLLVPENYTFKITSTIFSGPCKPGLVFQVRYITFSFCYKHFRAYVVILFLKISVRISIKVCIRYDWTYV